MSNIRLNSNNNISCLYTKIFHTALTIILALSACWAFPWMLKLHNNQLSYSNSIISVFVFGVFFYFISKARTAKYEGPYFRWFWPTLIGVIFSFCMVAGAQLDINENVPFTNVKMWLAIIILSIVFSLLIRYSWDVIFRSRFHYTYVLQGNTLQHPTHNTRFFIITAGVIFLCYFVVFLAVYPGFFVYDASDELTQVTTRNFTTHHPLAHVLMLGGLVQLGYKITGSYNTGIAIYTLVQMMIMSSIFAFCILKLRNRGLKKWGQALLTIYFGLFPVLVMFSLCSSKDGLFTGMLLILVLLLQDCICNPRYFSHKKGLSFY